MDHCKNPTQEKSPAEIILHLCTTDLSSDKESKVTTNDIMQLARLFKT